MAQSFDKKRIKDKVTVITGATSGLGREITLNIAKHGGKTAVCARNKDSLKQLAEELEDIYQNPAKFLTDKVDITKPDMLQNFAENITSRLGQPEVLIANAGMTDREHHTLETIPLELWNKIINVNLNGTFYTLRTFLPSLAKNQGNVVVMSSLLGQQGHGKAQDGPYCASKFGIEGLVEVAAEEYEDQLNINTLFPAEKVNTGFFSYLSREERENLADPGVIVEPALFLACLPPVSLTKHSLNAKKWRTSAAYKEKLLAMVKNSQGGN